MKHDTLRSHICHYSRIVTVSASVWLVYRRIQKSEKLADRSIDAATDSGQAYSHVTRDRSYYADRQAACQFIIAR